MLEKKLHWSRFDPFGKMAEPPLTAAILVVSETAYQNPATDRCFPTLRDVFESENRTGTRRQWTISSERRIVPDSMVKIQQRILAWTDGIAEGTDHMNLIVTSGGTGFAQKDVTPEVLDGFDGRCVVLES